MHATEPQGSSRDAALSTSRLIRIGARRSPLAQHHAHRLADAIRRAEPGVEVEVVGISTPGDRHRGPLHEIGGKGVFVVAIDQALQQGRIDIAAHCLKDVAGDVPDPDGLVWGAFVERDDPRDCIIFRKGSSHTSFRDLPHGARIGTGAPRRRAQLLKLRPDLVLAELRGNIGPRLDALDSSDLDAIVLARCALIRAGFEHRIDGVFAPSELVPAIGGGLLGARCRADDNRITAVLSRIDDQAARLHATAETAFRRHLNGNCFTAMAGHCGPYGDGLRMSGLVFSADGRASVSATRTGTADPAELGRAVAEALIADGARRLIDSPPA